MTEIGEERKNTNKHNINEPENKGQNPNPETRKVKNTGELKNKSGVIHLDKISLLCFHHHFLCLINRFRAYFDDR